MGFFEQRYSGQKMGRSEIRNTLRRHHILNMGDVTGRNLAGLVMYDSASLSERQKNYIRSKLKGSKIKMSKEILFVLLGFLACFAVVFGMHIAEDKGIGVGILIGCLIFFGVGSVISLWYVSQEQRSSMLQALDYGQYSAYLHTIENMKWASVGGGDGDSTETFFVVIQGVEVWVDSAFYNSVTIGEEILTVILKSGDKRYLVLVPFKV